MGVDWENFNFLEGSLKKHHDFRNETIEKLAVLINLEKPMTLWSLKKKIKKVSAFNEYLSFCILRAQCHREELVRIKSPDDLMNKIQSLNGEDPYLKKRLEEYYVEFKYLNSSPFRTKWDISPVFNIMAENYSLIEHIRVKKDTLYKRSSKGEMLNKDLINGLKKYGLLEFCLNGKEYKR